MHLFYEELKAKAKTVSPWALITTVALGLLEHRLYAWLNSKIDESAPHLFQITLSIFRIAAEHPINAVVYTFACFAAATILWAFISTVKVEMLEGSFGGANSLEGVPGTPLTDRIFGSRYTYGSLTFDRKRRRSRIACSP